MDGSDVRVTVQRAASQVSQVAHVLVQRRWYRHIDQQVRVKNTIMSIVGLVSIVLMIALILVDWNSAKNESTYTMTGLILQIINTIVTIVLLILIFDYYWLQAKVRCVQWNLRTPFDAFKYTDLKWRCIGEIVVCAIHPLPYAGRVIWGLGNKIGLFQFARLYLFLRVIRDSSDIYRFRRDIVSSNPAYRKNPPQFGCGMAIRTLFFDKTSLVLLALVVGSTLVASFAVYASERDDQQIFTSYWDCIWFTVASQTFLSTNMEPASFWGRIISFLQGIAGIFVVGIIIGILTNKLSPSDEQTHALNWIKNRRSNMKENLYAALLVQAQWRWHKRLISHDSYVSKYQKAVQGLMNIRGARMEERGAVSVNLKTMEKHLNENEEEHEETAKSGDDGVTEADFAEVDLDIDGIGHEDDDQQLVTLDMVNEKVVELVGESAEMRVLLVRLLTQLEESPLLKQRTTKSAALRFRAAAAKVKDVSKMGKEEKKKEKAEQRFPSSPRWPQVPPSGRVVETYDNDGDDDDNDTIDDSYKPEFRPSGSWK